MAKIIKTALALALLAGATAAQAQDRSGDPLQGLTQCFKGGEFHAEGTYRMSPSVVSRKVDTTTGPMYVSIADGYRLMIYRKSTSPFVNLKIERSVAGQFSADRDAILKQMATLAGGGRSTDLPPVETSTMNGIEIVAINNPPMTTPGVISMYQLFDAASGTIATAHLLNQEGPAREFNSEAAYGALRDKFIGVLSACLARRP
jgi:hypothetical protein